MSEEDGEIDPIIVADLAEDEETDPTIFVSLGEDGQKDQEEEHTREEEPPQSPLEEEERELAICIHPKVTSLPPHLKTMTGKLKVSPDWSLQMWTKTM